jgi:hypothetical protein
MYSLIFTEKEAVTDPNKLYSSKRHQIMSKTNKFFPYVYENNFNFFTRSTIKNNKVKKSTDKQIYESRKVPKDSINFDLMLTSTPIRFNFQENRDKHRRDSSIENKFGLFGDLMNLVDDLNLDFQNFDREKEDKEIVEKVIQNDINIDSGAESIFLTKIQNPVIKKYSNNKLEILKEEQTNNPFKSTVNEMREVHFKRKEEKNQLNILSTKLKRKYISPSNELENCYNFYREKTKEKSSFINKISSFEMKLNKELGKIIKGYGSNEQHIKFSQNPLIKNLYSKMPHYEVYKTMKSSESRPTHHYRYKLAPLRVSKKTDVFNRLGNNIYNYTDRHF